MALYIRSSDNAPPFNLPGIWDWADSKYLANGLIQVVAAVAIDFCTHEDDITDWFSENRIIQCRPLTGLYLFGNMNDALLFSLRWE